MRINSQDFFPGCLRDLSDEPTGNGTPYPIETADFDQVMNWFRRVRKWRAEFTAELSAGPQPFSVVADNDLELNERSRTCQMRLLSGEQVISGGADPRATFNIRFGSGVTEATAACLRGDGVYLPAISIITQCSDENVTGATLETVQVNPFDATVSVFIGGFTITGYVAYGEGGDPQFDMGNVTVTPEEWFPFGDADDADPILDTATGAQLRDPFAYPPTIGPYA